MIATPVSSHFSVLLWGKKKSKGRGCRMWRSVTQIRHKGIQVLRAQLPAQPSLSALPAAFLPSQPSASSLHCKPGPQQVAGTPGFQFNNTTGARFLTSRCPEKENWVLEGFGICPGWAEHLASDGGMCFEVKSLQYQTLRKLSPVH